jgi:hypothetical protein
MDDIVEDARREAEVLLSIWTDQNHGRGHEYKHEGCNMFVPLSCLDNSSPKDSRSCNSEHDNDSYGPERVGGVRWAQSDNFIGNDYETRASSSISPGDICTRASMAEGNSLEARRVTWGSCVGSNDQGVFEALKLFESIPRN